MLDSMAFCPPLIVGREDVDHLADVVERSLEALGGRLAA